MYFNQVIFVQVEMRVGCIPLLFLWLPCMLSPGCILDILSGWKHRIVGSSVQVIDRLVITGADVNKLFCILNKRRTNISAKKGIYHWVGHHPYSPSLYECFVNCCYYNVLTELYTSCIAIIFCVFALLTWCFLTWQKCGWFHMPKPSEITGGSLQKRPETAGNDDFSQWLDNSEKSPIAGFGELLSLMTFVHPGYLFLSGSRIKLQPIIPLFWPYLSGGIVDAHLL